MYTTNKKVSLQVGTSPVGAQPTKAIVFTQFWHHLYLIEKQLMDHGIGVAVLKGNMKPDEKARTLDQFKVLDLPHAWHCSLPAKDKAGFCTSFARPEKVNDGGKLEHLLGELSFVLHISEY